MNTKLTLSIDDTVISGAKSHLKNENQSLSKLVENYLRVLIKTKTSKNPQTTILGEITGLAKKGGDDPDRQILNYLNEKYK